MDRADARAWDLKGRICRLLHPDPESPCAWQSSLKFREKAAALAWRDLCRAAWRVKERDTQHSVLEAQRSALEPWRRALVIPFENLGMAHLKAGYLNSGILILRQAISQQPDEDLYLQLGEGLLKKKLTRGRRSLIGISLTPLNGLRIARVSGPMSPKPKRDGLMHLKTVEHGKQLWRLITWRSLLQQQWSSIRETNCARHALC
jgi:hypothetical protein